MGDSDYSFSLTTFSPSGKLVQIEYALNAVAAGSTSLGIKGLLSLFHPRGRLFLAYVYGGRRRVAASFWLHAFAAYDLAQGFDVRCWRAATNGVVVATEKKVSSPLVDETMVKKIAEIDKHLGMVYSGATRPLFSALVLHACSTRGCLLWQDDDATRRRRNALEFGRDCFAQSVPNKGRGLQGWGRTREC
jgi:20S proteasome subunit alpha 2